MSSVHEQWRDIPGYEGLYQVSDQGRVRSLDHYARSGFGSVRLAPGKVLKPGITVNGYAQVALSNDGQREYPFVHRLVAQAFHPNPKNKEQVNHKNGIKTDNRVDNLEWCSMSENLYHRHSVLGQPGGRRKAVVCVETGAIYPSAKAAAQALGVSRAGILRICKHNQKATRHGKLHFKFKEE